MSALNQQTLIYLHQDICIKIWHFTNTHFKYIYIIIIWHLNNISLKIYISASCYGNHDMLYQKKTSKNKYLHHDLALNQQTLIYLNHDKALYQQHFKYIYITIIWHLTNQVFKKYIISASCYGTSPTKNSNISALQYYSTLWYSITLPVYYLSGKSAMNLIK